jgi:hypothetical protein
MPRLSSSRSSGLTVAFFSLAMASFAGVRASRAAASHVQRRPRGVLTWEGNSDLPPEISSRPVFHQAHTQGVPTGGTTLARDINWQGRRELNSQPLVLETSALPIELHPCNTVRAGACRLQAPGDEPTLATYAYSKILVTTPEPTVRPPSRIAKRTPSSMAIGVISSTLNLALSPGMHISASPTRFALPVTSVVRK